MCFPLFSSKINTKQQFIELLVLCILCFREVQFINRTSRTTIRVVYLQCRTSNSDNEDVSLTNIPYFVLNIVYQLE